MKWLILQHEDSYSKIDSDKEDEIVLFSPIERAEAETDCDSDVTDDENEGIVHHMPRHLLTVLCLTNTLQLNLEETDERVFQPSKPQKQFKKKENKKKKEYGQRMTLKTLQRQLNYQPYFLT